MTRKNMKPKRKRKRWKPDPAWLAPVDPEQFMFCVELMEAARSGKMSVTRPKPLLLEDKGEVSEITFTDTSFNRGILAVGKHLHDVFPHKSDGHTPPQYYAMLNRVIAFEDFLARKIHDFRNTKGLAMVQIRCLGRV